MSYGVHDEPIRKVNFHGRPRSIRWARYEQGNGMALVLMDPGGETYAKATVSLVGSQPHVELAPDEVVIKDYSENAGMLLALEDANVVQRTGRTIRSGFVELPIVRLLPLPDGRMPMDVV